MMPAWAAFQVTVLITKLRGAPSAVAASRNPSGTRISMFSVVRSTTGITITVSDRAPAMAEKCPIRTTTTS